MKLRRKCEKKRLPPDPQRREQVRQPVVVDLVHQRQQASNVGLGKTFAGKPVKVVTRQIGNHRALVFAKGHGYGNEALELELGRIHSG